MTFSLTAFLTVIFFSSILIVLIWFFLKNNQLIKQIGIGTLFFCIAVIVIRLLIPFEFSFASNLAVDRVFPEIISFLETPVIAFSGYNICLCHILRLLWITGAAVGLGKTIRTYACFKRSMDIFSAATDRRIQNALQRVNSKYKKPVAFEVVQTGIISTPVIFGIRKPRIVVPQMELSEEEWQHILNHETAHYYHGDLWAKMIIELLCIVYWWNPFVYLLKKQLSKALEIHIDLTVTKPMSEIERIEYLECLLKIAKMRADKESNKLALTFGSESSYTLSQRVHIVFADFNQKTNVNLKSVFMAVVPVILLLILSFLFVFEPYSISPRDAAHTVALTSETAYLVQNQDKGYDVYLDDQYFGTVTEIKDSFSGLPIYKNIEEVQKK